MKTIKQLNLDILTQNALCHIVNFVFIHPPSKFKIYSITVKSPYISALNG